MNSVLVAIQEKVQQLSPQRQNELIDFADFLLNKEATLATSAISLGEPKFDWVDGPDADPLPYTSVELQHLATEHRIEEELDLR